MDATGGFNIWYIYWFFPLLYSLITQVQSQPENQIDSCMKNLYTKLIDVQSALDLYLVKLIEEGYQNNIGEFDTTICKN